jgi:hypothetical protein
VIGGALVALLIAGTADVVLSSEAPESESNGTRETQAARASAASANQGETSPLQITANAPLPPCEVQNLALSIDLLGGSPFIALRHAWGKPCHLRRLPVHLTVKDRTGERVEVAYTQSRIAGDFTLDFERLLGITYRPTCKQHRPFIAFVTVGPAYSARRRLPDFPCHGPPVIAGN